MIKIELGLLALSPCHAVAYDMQTEMSSSPAGGSLRQAQDRLRLPAGKHTGILTDFQTIVNKKMKKSAFFGPQRGTENRNGPINSRISWNRDSSEIVHAPNLKNKIGAGSALILSLRNSGAR